MRDVEQQTFTVSEFCERNKISPPAFCNLRRKGLGPKEMHMGRKTRISVQAEADWREAHKARVSEEAAALVAECPNFEVMYEMAWRALTYVADHGCDDAFREKALAFADYMIENQDHFVAELINNGVQTP